MSIEINRARMADAFAKCDVAQAAFGVALRLATEAYEIVGGELAFGNDPQTEDGQRLQEFADALKAFRKGILAADIESPNTRDAREALEQIHASRAVRRDAQAPVRAFAPAARINLTNAVQAIPA